MARRVGLPPAFQQSINLETSFLSIISGQEGGLAPAVSKP